MGAISDKRLGDFLPTVDAYRPVALAVAAILGLVLVVPGAKGGDAASSTERFETAAADAPTSGSDPGGPGEGATVDAGGVPGTPAAGPAPITRAPSPAPTSRLPSSSSSSGRAPEPAGTSQPSAPARLSPITPSDPGEPDASPLRIVASGWASSTGGSPVPVSSAEGIPEGTLPVGTRVGQADKVSFLRMSGAGSTLVLAEDAAGRRGNAFEASPVQLCRLTDESWEEGGGQAMSDAPAHDPEACTPGRQQPDGTWAFGLAGFEDPADPRGFAIVPTADAPLDFQITFAGQAIS